MEKILKFVTTLQTLGKAITRHVISMNVMALQWLCCSTHCIIGALLLNYAKQICNDFLTIKPYVVDIFTDVNVSRKKKKKSSLM